MNRLMISDTTLKLNKSTLSFRKKIDIAAILDSLKIPVIEMGEISASTEDRLLIKTVASQVNEGILAVSIGLDASLAKPCMESLSTAKHPRLQVTAPLSVARMEYVYRKKAPQVLEDIKNAVSACKALCEDVEFVAEDATRADFEFLKTAIDCAIDEGAATVTICDTAGNALPDEFAQFLTQIKEEIPSLKDINIGVECNNGLGLANACAASAMKVGVNEIKVSACNTDTVSLMGILKILNAKVGAFPMPAMLNIENFAQPIKVITNLCDMSADGKSLFENNIRKVPGDVYFTDKDSCETVCNEIQKLGYILSDEDRDKVYKAFKRIVSRKDRIDLHELEIIVASEALQVPQTYRLESTTVTTGNNCEALAHIKLSRKGEIIDGISLGNGSVDASFLAIERITGCHYELDDFQIQAITEGKEAMGQTLVKLRSKGKVYSGKGVSTDIVISAIEAYLNSLNKIVYEEDKA